VTTKVVCADAIRGRRIIASESARILERVDEVDVHMIENLQVVVRGTQEYLRIPGICLDR
jgi:hypothetical protein